MAANVHAKLSTHRGKSALLAVSVQRLVSGTTSGSRGRVSNRLLHRAITQNALRKLLLCFSETSSSAAVDTMNLCVNSSTSHLMQQRQSAKNTEKIISEIKQQQLTNISLYSPFYPEQTSARLTLCRACKVTCVIIRYFNHFHYLLSF